MKVTLRITKKQCEGLSGAITDAMNWELSICAAYMDKNGKATDKKQYSIAVSRLRKLQRLSKSFDASVKKAGTKQCEPLKSSVVNRRNWQKKS
jgi:hypothetical protein